MGLVMQSVGGVEPQIIPGLRGRYGLVEQGGVDETNQIVGGRTTLVGSPHPFQRRSEVSSLVITDRVVAESAERLGHPPVLVEVLWVCQPVAKRFGHAGGRVAFAPMFQPAGGVVDDGAIPRRSP